MVSVARRLLRASPAARTILQTQRSVRLLTPAGRFCARQTVSGRSGTYRLRANGTTVHVRHRSRDLDILTEIFGRGTYEPPRALAPMLQGPLRVTDAGGNIGLFGVFALERWDVTSIVSYEPDPLNAQLLMATAAPHPAWHVVPAAVSNSAGTLRFRAGMHSESRAALPGEEGLTVPTVDVYDGPAVDLFKMDIEGGEWAILTDARLAELATRAVVLEWHANGCPAPDPGEHARRLLRAAGFTEQHRGEECPENGLLWVWRP